MIRIARFYGGHRSVELFYIAVLVLGFIWCREIFSRLAEDVGIFKPGADRAEKWVTLIYWVLTAGITALMAYSAWTRTVKIIDFAK
ncbi:MAG: hypothetical protein HZA49_01520 [Planctomycetes bacterium]|nr:hypothetical protein [Planctomycetota bacterium]